MDKALVKEADEKLNKVILGFFMDDKEFWTLLATQYKRIPVEGIKTVTTRITEKGIELLYDPELILKAKTDQIKYYIIHESLHLIYRHAYRFAVSTDVVDLATLKSKVPVTKEPKSPIKSADIAADLIVNRDLSDILGDRIVAEYGVTVDDLPDLGYENTCREYYYRKDRKSMFNVQSEDLEQEVINTYTEVQMPKQGGQAMPGEGQGGGEGEGQGQGKEGDGEDQKEGEGEGSSTSTVKGKKVNKHMSVDVKNPLQKQLGQHFVEEMIKQAAKQVGSKGQGHLPSSVQAELEALFNPPKKDWRKILANYVEASIPAQSTKTWANLHRVYPYLRKGKKKRRVPLIGLVQDTSGSVSDAAIAAFYREIDSIRKILKTDIELVQCDAEISDTRIISYKEKLTWSVSGRGGTEFLPALEYFDKAKRRPDVVVFFTDLQVSDSDVPADPRAYKIIWVSVDKDMCDHFAGLGKYGTFIHLDVDTIDEEAVR